VASGPSAGAEDDHFFHGARADAYLASMPLVKRPVDSTTVRYTAPDGVPIGQFRRDLWFENLKALPSTAIVSSVCVTLWGKVAKDRVVLQKMRESSSQSVDVVYGDETGCPRSSSAVRMILRPMRPKPLMPTLMGIPSS